ncbi:uncharacterized protein LOC128389104 [Panonychus citri]|uniref:uncharacterized protein LOC128389104 n=1 Tax=Panonychus citri TaxID=50023 RepID=UPI00230756A1|nr:uncharacterized protein LOC128389104 [Panonychus citri]
MSIDWCNLKYGTSAELGKGISFVDSTSSIAFITTLERGEISRSTVPSATKDIEFKFKVPIDLRAITFSYSIDSQFRQQSSTRTCGLKVLTWQAQDEQQQQNIFDAPNEILPNRIFRCPALPKQNVTIINKAYQISDNMRNSGFNMDPCYPLIDSVKFGISSDHQSSCLNINKLKIKLSHLPERTRITFNKVVILGQPSPQSFTDPSFRSITDRILNHKPEIPKTPVKAPHRRPMFNHLPGSASRGLQMVEASTRAQENNIPAEFIDPFTSQLMEFPMLLPCGKNCDRAYLHKYIRLEKKWSRKPSDPFTGITFSREQIPTIDNELKKRIDKWCLLSMFDSIPDWYSG